MIHKDYIDGDTDLKRQQLSVETYKTISCSNQSSIENILGGLISCQNDVRAFLHCFSCFKKLSKFEIVFFLFCQTQSREYKLTEFEHLELLRICLCSTSDLQMCLLREREPH